MTSEVSPPSSPATAAEVRTRITEALRLDLIGPRAGDPTHSAYEHEALPQAPTQWYLTGFLIPHETDVIDRADEDQDDEVDAGGDSGAAGDDGETPEKSAARKGYYASSMGISVLVPAGVTSLQVDARWGRYDVVNVATEPGDEDLEWHRQPGEASVNLELPKPGQKREMPVWGAPPSAITLVAVCCEVGGNLVESGARSVSVFLVNNLVPEKGERRDLTSIFQPVLTLTCATPFVPRPDLHSQGRGDRDEQIADLQFRDEAEFAVGHNVSVTEHREPAGSCRRLSTQWLPSAEVEKVVPSKIDGATLDLEALAELDTFEELQAALSPLVDQYRDWIEARGKELEVEQSRKDVADYLLDQANTAARRIAAGIEVLRGDQEREAFRLMNTCIAKALRRRAVHGQPDPDPTSVARPEWRPFQLAFILLSLRSMAEPTDDERRIVDLLFFPTGGGKTEAYLGLAAFALVRRRLQAAGVDSAAIQGAGVAVLMRYTLRLLTLDQLSRASTLICALELERQQDPERLGGWPFEIGLWVGRAATPNRLGGMGDKDPHCAYHKKRKFEAEPNKQPAPIPLEDCPWCGTKFDRRSFLLQPDARNPIDLLVGCPRAQCEFSFDRSQNRGLPVLGVDEPIYRRLPCFIIATVDKFAALPWRGETGALFGQVQRHDGDGFYGAMTPGKGQPLPGGRLPPPELIIQDELHLISGPLGTMVGLYETAIDALSTHEVDGVTVQPKLIASTATVRRAAQQVRALYGRKVAIFPPPGPDHRDSFFAHTVASDVENARLYLGVAAPGRSLKVVLLRTYLALLCAAQHEWEAAGGAACVPNPADPYMSVLGYFNSLRELGGSRRIVEDEVMTRAAEYGDRRRRIGEPVVRFANRPELGNPEELTSRVSTAEVSKTKRRLSLAHSPEAHLDVCLATNMISVGLDITRLGLMVVLGQPKTTAEYIQATSRVGRKSELPGLVLTLMNVHRPRDRSHYERFTSWHRSFYRGVEATSVTPFSPRALERGLAAVAVALARHGWSELTPAKAAGDIARHRAHLEFVAERLAERAAAHDGQMSQADIDHLRTDLVHQVDDLIESWQRLAALGGALQYGQEADATRLLHDFLDPKLNNLEPEFHKFRAQRSMREVEPVVDLKLYRPKGGRKG